MAAERKTKTEDGMEFPAEAYAYVPDPDKPSTWKLRLWETPQSKETPRQVGMAIAALGPGGFRGNRVEIPPEDLPTVKARIRAAWKKVHPDADPDEMPPLLREDTGHGQGQDVTMDGPGQRLVEYTSSTGLALRVDRQRGLIQGVKVLGLESANGRWYAPQTLQAAIKLYEGKPVNIDHGNGPRSYRDRIGRLVNVRMGGDGLYGDLVINPAHPLAEQLFWDAEHAPENVGLSHDARGRTAYRQGRIIVEAIEAVRSVDLVAEPATVKSLYEAVDAVMAADAAQTEPQPSVSPADDVSDDDQDKVDPDLLPDESFALVLPGGVKIRDRTYPLSKRYFPLHTPAAVKRSLMAIVSNKKLSAQHRGMALERAKQAAIRFGINYQAILSQVKETTMDLSSLTLADLKEARPDLVEAIRSSGELEKQLLELKEERDRLAAELETMKRRVELEEQIAQAGLSREEIPQFARRALETASDAQERQKILEEVKQWMTRTKPVASRPGAKPQVDLEELVASWRV